MVTSSLPGTQAGVAVNIRLLTSLLYKPAPEGYIHDMCRLHAPRSGALMLQLEGFARQASLHIIQNGGQPEHPLC